MWTSVLMNGHGLIHLKGHFSDFFCDASTSGVNRPEVARIEVNVVDFHETDLHWFFRDANLKSYLGREHCSVISTRNLLVMRNCGIISRTFPISRIVPMVIRQVVENCGRGEMTAFANIHVSIKERKFIWKKLIFHDFFCNLKISYLIPMSQRVTCYFLAGLSRVQR